MVVEYTTTISGLKESGSRYEFEMSRLKADYEQQMQSVNRSMGSEFQSKTQVYDREIQNLKGALNEKNIESERHRATINELQNALNRLELDSTSKIKTYEANLNNLKRENEDIYMKLKNLGEADRKAYMLESRVKEFERQLESSTI